MSRYAASWALLVCTMAQTHRVISVHATATPATVCQCHSEHACGVPVWHAIAWAWWWLPCMQLSVAETPPPAQHRRSRGVGSKYVQCSMVAQAYNLAAAIPGYASSIILTCFILFLSALWSEPAPPTFWVLSSHAQAAASFARESCRPEMHMYAQPQGA